MKYLFTYLIILLFTHFSSAQPLTHEDFGRLMPSIKQENWKSTFDESSKLLYREPNDTSDYHAIILYIHIFSGAGLVSQKQMSYKTLKDSILKDQGQRIIMPSHPITYKDGQLKHVKLEISDTSNRAFTVATNNSGTSIMCFEYFNFKDKINVNDFPINAYVRCGGILDKIEMNPNKSTIWILRLHVKDAFLRRTN